MMRAIELLGHCHKCKFQGLWWHHTSNVFFDNHVCSLRAFLSHISVLVHGRVQSSAACVHATFRPSIFFLQGLWSNLRMELSHQINDGARLGGHSFKLAHDDIRWNCKSGVLKKNWACTALKLKRAISSLSTSAAARARSENKQETKDGCRAAFSITTMKNATIRNKAPTYRAMEARWKQKQMKMGEKASATGGKCIFAASSTKLRECTFSSEKGSTHCWL